ncbi:MAG TPA: ribosome biogenesis GTP-binding protein YihA/YsxC [Chitinophagaceae bacterium]|nr:ribosome biogenesis GTP-binding protein YihA/YsxC [Chitinophagaceae bacterium]
MEIVSAEFVISSATHKQCPAPDKPEYAFIGRSNVGKSSLINMLCNRKDLAKTSATPGKTQLINHFLIVSRKRSGRQTRWYLVDLPGYGYAVVSQRSRRNLSNMIESYVRKRENLVNLFVLIDTRLEPQQKDLEFISSLGEWQVPFALVFTKSDKNKPAITQKKVAQFLDRLRENWEELPPYFVTSATKKTGREELLRYISGLNDRLGAG